jgi:DNA-binding MarR family transcriptional regulator
MASAHLDRKTASLVDQVVALTARSVDRLRPVLRELELSEPAGNLLWSVDPEAEPAPLRQLAERLHCDPSNVTLLAARLEERGLAERRPHPRDGRIRTLVLTEAGRAARARLVEQAETTSPFAALTDAEQQALHDLLTKALASRTTR